MQITTTVVIDVPDTMPNPPNLSRTIFARGITAGAILAVLAGLDPQSKAWFDRLLQRAGPDQEEKPLPRRRGPTTAFIVRIPRLGVAQVVVRGKPVGQYQIRRYCNSDPVMYDATITIASATTEFKLIRTLEDGDALEQECRELMEAEDILALGVFLADQPGKPDCSHIVMVREWYPMPMKEEETL